MHGVLTTGWNQAARLDLNDSELLQRMLQMV